MFDYVIVGAGSAGCVLAARLSADPQVSVCLIEAGGWDSADDIHVPAAFGTLFRTHVDWDYDTHEEEHLNRRRIYLPRGRVIGGTSSINAMVYARGNRVDFDEWGVPGWTYDEMLPYFRRSENNERGASEFHGVGGPLSVADGRSNNPMSRAFVEAAVEAGHSFNDDFNGPNQEGFGFFQVTQRDGRRCSAAAAFLHPVLDRPNLTVETDLQVHRVLVDEGRATGVVGMRRSEEITIHASAEVILAAGAYNSPQLLMLSGIGPADQLGALGIETLVDQQAVGQNLQDHALVPLIYAHSSPVSLLTATEPENVRRFAEEGTGPMTSNGPEAGGFVRTSGTLDAPDLEFLTAPVMFADSGLGAPTAHAFSTGPVLLTPSSRGSVSLASANPTAKPRVLHNYFADSVDLDRAVEGLRIGMNIARQGALAEYVENEYRTPESDSTDDLREFVRRFAHSLYHASGTCAIGSVVDSDLQVHGVESLRVVDASVMPLVGRGNLNACVIAIAERAADLVIGRKMKDDAGERMSDAA